MHHHHHHHHHHSNSHTHITKQQQPMRQDHEMRCINEFLYKSIWCIRVGKKGMISRGGGWYVKRTIRMRECVYEREQWGKRLPNNGVYVRVCVCIFVLCRPPLAHTHDCHTTCTCISFANNSAICGNAIEPCVYHDNNIANMMTIDNACCDCLWWCYPCFHKSRAKKPKACCILAFVFSA